MLVCAKHLQNIYLQIYVNTLIFYKQPVSKQLALRWQIVNQLARLNPLSLSNNKNYRLKKTGNKHKKAVKLTIHQNATSQKYY